MKPFITVFTPTFNRVNELKRAYLSLLKQTNNNFLWMIVDDGSTDSTEIEVNKWLNDFNNFEIVYIKQTNGGKASAINNSLSQTKTPLWVCLDSDDYLTEDAIQTLLNNYEEIKEDDNVCGMLALRTGTDGEVMNHQKEIPLNVTRLKLKDLNKKLKIFTETMLVYKTEIIREYPYPTVVGEKHFPLDYAYALIDLEYDYFVLHDHLMISEYQENGITRNLRKYISNNPRSYTLSNRTKIEIAENFEELMRASILYNVGIILDKNNNFKRSFRDSPNKVSTTLTYPIGYLYYTLKY